MLRLELLGGSLGTFLGLGEEGRHDIKGRLGWEGSQSRLGLGSSWTRRKSKGKAEQNVEHVKGGAKVESWEGNDVGKKEKPMTAEEAR